MGADAHLCRETWAMVTNALIQCLLTENVIQEAHDLVTQSLSTAGRKRLEF